MDRIKELVTLLLADFELENEEEIIANLTLAKENPTEYLKENDAEWLEEFAPEDALQFAITNEIYDFIIVGDKIDEIHELIVDEFEGDFPEYPYELKLNTQEYLEWVSKQVDENYPDLELIEFGDSFGDSIQLLLVLKKDVARIKELASEFNIRCNKTDEILKL
jgi:hypothetical protein